MAEPTFEHGLTETIVDILADIDGEKFVSAGTNRIGTIKLNDGRQAQIHVTVTTNPSEFLKKVTNLRRR